MSYTPTTDWVRTAWGVAREKIDGHPLEVSLPEFDRWLTAHDAEVAAQALEDAADSYCPRVPQDAPTRMGLSRKVVFTRAWLRSLAAEKRGA